MKLFKSLMLTCISVPLIVAAQPCLEEGIFFMSQSQIDSFSINYPTCTRIEGDVRISGGEDVNDLQGLNQLVEIRGNLMIRQTYYLMDLTGLENLERIDGNLSLGWCQNLQSLNGLNNLTEIGGSLFVRESFELEGFAGLNRLKSVGGNFVLTRLNNFINLSGLDSLSYIGDTLKIYSVYGLEDLTGLESLKTIGGGVALGRYDKYLYHYRGNPYLKSLKGLHNLVSINGDIELWGNGNLQDISALQNIDQNTIHNLSIVGNYSLSSCDINNFCEYLANPNGVVTIYQNGEGCNSPADIARDCGFTMPCLPHGDYYFHSQEQVDNFKVDYPGCTYLKGNVEIESADIQHLDGLSEVVVVEQDLILNEDSTLQSLGGLRELRIVGGDLQLVRLTDLTTLAGIEKLDAIGGSMLISYNDRLVDLAGLEGLSELGGGMWIYGNDSLKSLHGLENVTKVPADIYLKLNPLLSDVTGLNNITEIGESLSISQHASMKNLQGLNALSRIGEDLTLTSNYNMEYLSGLGNLENVGDDLFISGMDMLPDLQGLENLTTLGGGLYIRDNEGITNVSALRSLSSVGGNVTIDYNGALTSLQGLANIDYTTIKDLRIESNFNLWNCSARSICDYIDDPGGFFSILWNKEGCANVVEVSNNCQHPAVGEIKAINNFSTEPNPFSKQLIVTYELQKDSKVDVSVFNQLSKLVFTQSQHQMAGAQKMQLNLQDLSPGLYLVRLQTLNGAISKKVIKK
jgi:hypothetical protein